MTDQPTNPNEFILISAYKPTAQHSKAASILVFRFACNNAKLRKTVVNSSLDSKLSENSSIAVMRQDGRDSLVLIPNETSLAIVDCKKLMKDLNCLDKKVDRTDIDYKIDHQIWEQLKVTNSTFLMVIWKDIVIGILENGYLAFVKDGKVISESKETPEGSCPIKPLRFANKLCMYGRCAYVWRDTLFYVSEGLNQLCSTDLKATIESKKTVQVIHSIVCIALDIDRSGMAATVTADGHVTAIDLSRGSLSRISDAAIRSKLPVAVNEVYQAVGISDNTILLGSAIRSKEGPEIQKFTLMRRSGHRQPSSVEISSHGTFIHSIVFVGRRGVQFAVVVNFRVDCHLLAVRHDRLQVVQQGVAVSGNYVNACCVYGEAVFVVGHDKLQRLVKLDVVF